MGAARFAVNGRARLLLALAALLAVAGAITVGSGRAADPPTVTLTGPANPIVEGSAGSFEIKVSGGEPNTSYDFNWALTAGATPSAASSDFPATTGGPVTVTTGDGGSGSASFNVATTDDQVYEASDENFKVTLSSGGAEAAASIHDNDPKPAITIQDASGQEGNSGTSKLTFNVTIDRPSHDPITFNIQTSPGSASTPEDFVNGSGTWFTIPRRARPPLLRRFR